jgi:hypothetical protein
MSYTVVRDLNKLQPHESVWFKGGVSPHIFTSVFDAGVWPCSCLSLWRGDCLASTASLEVSEERKISRFSSEHLVSSPTLEWLKYPFLRSVTKCTRARDPPYPDPDVPPPLEFRLPPRCFWRRLAVSHRRFGKTYRAHLQVWCIPRKVFLHCLPPKMGAIIYPDTFEKKVFGAPEVWDRHVLKIRRTPQNVPEERRPQMSLVSMVFLHYFKTF